MVDLDLSALIYLAIRVLWNSSVTNVGDLYTSIGLFFFFIYAEYTIK